MTSAEWRIRAYLAAIGLGMLGLAVQVRAFDPVAQPALTLLFSTSTPREPTRIFIVLDTVRADRLSLCGHGRPTSPTLERLKADGASVSCGAVAPGPWTLPSHASFFTGVLPPQHHADFVAIAGNGGLDLNGTPVQALDATLPTLAEDLGGTGFQTAAVSGNLVVSDVTGVLRGFEHKRFPSAAYYREDALIDQLRRMLRFDLAHDGSPLFLFVNVIDAHQPYPGVPTGLKWVKGQPGLHFDPSDEEDLWDRFVNGRMEPAEREAFLSHLDDVYDYGVFLADRTLGRILDELEGHGWLEGGYQLVITSDHGEFLGEHGLLEHGAYLYEPVVNVPFVLLDTTGTSELPARMSAMEAYPLLKNGALSGLDVQATAQPNTGWYGRTDGRLGGATSAARWEGDEKELWMNGETLHFDLASDPGEEAGVPAEASPALEALGTSLQKGVRGDATPEMIEMLKAVGYLDE